MEIVRFADEDPEVDYLICQSNYTSYQSKKTVWITKLGNRVVFLPLIPVHSFSDKGESDLLASDEVENV